MRSILASFFPSLCVLQMGFHTPRVIVSVSFHALYSDVPGSNLDTGTGCRDRFVVAF
jgi:hypothetical protein